MQVEHVLAQQESLLVITLTKRFYRNLFSAKSEKSWAWNSSPETSFPLFLHQQLEKTKQHWRRYPRISELCFHEQKTKEYNLNVKYFLFYSSPIINEHGNCICRRTLLTPFCCCWRTWMKRSFTSYTRPLRTDCRLTRWTKCWQTHVRHRKLLTSNTEAFHCMRSKRLPWLCNCSTHVT